MEPNDRRSGDDRRDVVRRIPESSPDNGSKFPKVAGAAVATLLGLSLVYRATSDIVTATAEYPLLKQRVETLEKAAEEDHQILKRLEAFMNRYEGEQARKKPQ